MSLSAVTGLGEGMGDSARCHSGHAGRLDPAVTHTRDRWWLASALVALGLAVVATTCHGRGGGTASAHAPVVPAARVRVAAATDAEAVLKATASATPGARPPGPKVVAPKAVIEARLGVTVTSFAYPSGRNDATTVDVLRAGGYRAAVTTDPGTWQFAASSYQLGRVRVPGGDSIAGFHAALERQLGP